MRRAKCSLVAILSLAALACGSTDSEDRCSEGGEFANDGCAAVAGTVRSPSGDPLIGVVVSLQPETTDPAAYTSPSTVTGVAGSYRLELVRLASEVPPQPRASLHLVVTLVREIPISDSTLIEVEFAPVGGETPVTQVDVVFDTLASAANAP